MERMRKNEAHQKWIKGGGAPEDDPSDDSYDARFRRAGKAISSTFTGAVDTVKSTASSAATAVSTKAASLGNAVADTAMSAHSAVVAGTVDLAEKGVGLVNKGSQLVKDYLGNTFTAGGNVDVQGLNPGLQANLVGMGKDYYQATGKKLQINSANRSNEEQARLYKTMPKGMAAPPGSSLHNYGLAVDINSQQANELSNMGLLSKYGFERPIAKEKWHMQPKGLTVAAAKAGIYSADGPGDQMGPGDASGKSTPSAQALSPTSSPTANASSGNPTQVNAGGQRQTTSDTVGGSSRNSVSSIPTFDGSDGMFLSLNMGM